MTTQKFNRLGWILAGALCGVMLGSGFQGANDKSGVVDLNKVVEGSDLGKKNKTQFDAMVKAREDLLAFVTENPIISVDQSQRLRDLSLKTTRTAEEGAELERIKAEINTAMKKQQELSTKTLTPEERNLMEEYARRAQQMNQTVGRWHGEFTREMQGWTNKEKSAELDKARAAAQQVAKTGGYTLIFESSVAPYGANDITAETTAAMNAAK